MKVYFSASLSGLAGKERALKLINLIEKSGHTILGKKQLLDQNISCSACSSRKDHHMQCCELAVLEGSMPVSIAVSYDLGRLIERSKPIIFLYENETDRRLLTARDKMVVSQYSQEDLGEVLDWAFSEVKHNLYRRFTFFISPKIDTFLDFIVKKQKISRSEYIRDLIEKNMLDSYPI